MNLRTLFAMAAAAAALAAATGMAAGAGTLGELLQRTHVHGLAVDRGDPERLLVATHHGLYAAQPDGTVEQVSPHQDDLMGFSAHLTEPDVIYASGHPAGGGNLGVIRSDDGGQSWALVSPGEEDFPRWLRRSEEISEDPVLHIAADPADPSRLFAATMRGTILRSDDGGATWSQMASR
jgi:photosystem II stability/assembly factor-like uncharacterized protein